MKKEIQGSWNRLSAAFSRLETSPDQFSSTNPSGRRIFSISESKRSHTNFFTPVKSPGSRPETASLRTWGCWRSKDSWQDYVPQTVLKSLFHCKCKDLGIWPKPDQEKRFYVYCEKSFRSKSIVFKEAGIGKSSAKVLGAFLEKNPNFTQLVLSKNLLGDSGLLCLNEFLKRNFTLVHLDLSSNNFSPDAIPPLFAMLRRHQSIVSVNLASIEGLHRNRLGTKGSQAFNDLLKSPILSILNVAGTSIGNDGLAYLSQSLNGNYTLISLNISNNEVSCKAIDAFVEACIPSSIQDLNLSHNKISDEGAAKISKMLDDSWVSIGKVAWLDLSRNAINSTGAFSIFTALKNNAVLKRLNLEGNPIGNYGANSINSCLHFNNILNSLNLSDCDLGSEALETISIGLAVNTGLAVLLLSKNRIENSGIFEFAKILLKNSTLKSVDFSYNFVSNEGAFALAQHLKQNFTLKKINLANNNIKDEAAVELVELVRGNPHITNMNLDQNVIGKKHLIQVKQHLEKNKSKKQLPKVETKRSRVDPKKITQLEMMTKEKLQEQVEVEDKLEKHKTKLKESKKTETEKFRELRLSYEALRANSRKCTRNLEIVWSEYDKTQRVGEATVKNIQKECSYLVADAKSLEKKSKLYIENALKEEFNLKRLHLENVLKTIGKELKEDGIQYQKANIELNRLKQVVEELKLAIEKRKEPRRKGRKTRLNSVHTSKKLFKIRSIKVAK